MTPRRDRLRLLALLCAPVLLTSGAASAQAADESKVEAEAPKEASADEGSEEGEEEKEDPNAFPLSASANLSNALGSGWLGAGYTQNPYFSQTLTPSLSYKLPKADYLPTMAVSTRMDVSVQWISNHFSETYDRVPRTSDLFGTLSFPGFYKEEITGVKLSGSLGVRAPLSLLSRRWNVLGSLSGGGSVGWSTAHLEDMVPEWLGDFSLTYAPNVSVSGHTSPNPSLPCDGAALGADAVRFGNAAENLDRVPLVITREGEINVNGECIIPGRRVIGGFSHSLSAGWSHGKHSVGASFGLIYQLLAPLSSAPELSSPFATAQNWSELSTGSLSYTYSVPMESFDLPMDTSLALTAGVSSFQPSYHLDGKNLRFPFWDFVTPQNNFSAAFVAIDVGI